MGGVRELMFPHCVNLLEAEWNNMKQEYGETGMSYRNRFKRLAGGLNRDSEGCKIKFVQGLYNPEVKKSICMTCNFADNHRP